VEEFNLLLHGLVDMVYILNGVPIFLPVSLQRRYAWPGLYRVR
jgi:hypothetical protein